MWQNIFLKNRSQESFPGMFILGYPESGYVMYNLLVKTFYYNPWRKLRSKHVQSTLFDINIIFSTDDIVRPKSTKKPRVKNKSFIMIFLDSSSTDFRFFSNFQFQACTCWITYRNSINRTDVTQPNLHNTKIFSKIMQKTVRRTIA